MTELDSRDANDNPFASHSPAGPAADAGWEAPPSRKGFFTDTSICIGCKACEVACKEWNGIPQDGIYELLGSSYDNTGALGASTWRHVEFIEQRLPLGGQDTGVVIPMVTGEGSALRQAQGAAGQAQGAAGQAQGAAAPSVDLGMPGLAPPGAGTGEDERSEFRWLMASNVCKHCTNAGCLDVCPTGALFRTEFGTVVVQEDICNGCGYCVAACPFGVIDRRIGNQHHPEAPPVKNQGIAQKCTLCYDRLSADQTPACAQACPTQSIQFGDLDELRERAERRVETLHANGVPEAQLYAEDPDNGVGGAGAFFLLLDEPEVYGFPPDPIVTTADLPRMWKNAALAAGGLLLAGISAFLGSRR